MSTNENEQQASAPATAEQQAAAVTTVNVQGVLNLPAVNIDRAWILYTDEESERQREVRSKALLAMLDRMRSRLSPGTFWN